VHKELGIGDLKFYAHAHNAQENEKGALNNSQQPE